MDRKRTKSVTIVNDIRNDIIVIDQVQSDYILKGVKYFGYNPNIKRSTQGKVHYYAEFPQYIAPCSKISRKEVQKRAKFIDDVACCVAKTTEDVGLLNTELIRQKKDVFINSLKDSGIMVMETLTPKDAVSIQSLLRLPTNKVRNLRTCRSKLSANIFPSERKMRKESAHHVSLINKNSVETGFIGLRCTKNEENVTACPFLRVKNIKEYIEEIISRDTAGFRHDDQFDNKWWLLFSGDKMGGGGGGGI